MNDQEIEKKPNKETLEAFKELDNGGGTHFEGRTTELLADLLRPEK